MTTLITPAIEVLTRSRDRVGESPLWSPAEQCLYWVDIEGRLIHRHDWASRDTRSWQCHERVACLALRAGGGLVAGMESGLFAVDLPASSAQVQTHRLTPVAHPQEGMRFNDGRCDRQGRLWASTMVMDMTLKAAQGSLYRYDGHTLSAPLVQGLITGNGLGFSPDGRVMYLSDSHPSVQRIWRFELDNEGVPRHRQEFVDMNLYPGRPDGGAVDAEGCYWICGNDAGQIHRFTPQGRLDKSLVLPVSKPAMCSFGGPGMEWLFVTSITPAQPAPGFDASLDGAVLVLRPGVCGLEEKPLAR